MIEYIRSHEPETYPVSQNAGGQTRLARFYTVT